jgi:hypothetical protein
MVLKINKCNGKIFFISYKGKHITQTIHALHKQCKKPKFTVYEKFYTKPCAVIIFETGLTFIKNFL